MSGLGWAALLLAVGVFWTLGAYNRLVSLRNGIGQAWQTVNEALARRGDAVALLVTALRSPLASEAAALDALLTAQARAAAAAEALSARPVLAPQAEAMVRAEAAMASATARVLALLDLQPELTALDEVAQPAAALRDVEPRLVFARQLFNDAVQAYNEAVRQFPTRLLARLYGFGTAGRI